MNGPGEAEVAERCPAVVKGGRPGITGRLQLAGCSCEWGEVVGVRAEGVRLRYLGSRFAPWLWLDRAVEG